MADLLPLAEEALMVAHDPELIEYLKDYIEFYKIFKDK